MRWVSVLTGFAAAYLSVAGSLAADGPAQAPTQGAKPSSLFQRSPLFWQTDAIIDSVASTISRHYNLDEKQDEYTRKLLTQRVKRFLHEHERETRALLAEYMGYQISGQLPPAEAAKDFAKRARPMIATIHKEIVDGNMKWREILNEDQKKLHDRDLNYIDRSFQQQDEKFNRWSKGEIEPTDLPSTIGQRPGQVMKGEDAWTYFVMRFKQDYRLDAGQQDTADSVLRVLRQEATVYREAHKQEFADLEAKYKEIADSTPQATPEAVKEAQQKRKELDRKREQLEKPISVEMFNRLKTQLLAIPRGDQKAAYEKREAKLSREAELARKAFTARKLTTQPASRPAEGETQPADTSPATS